MMSYSTYLCVNTSCKYISEVRVTTGSSDLHTLRAHFNTEKTPVEYFVCQLRCMDSASKQRCLCHVHHIIQHRRQKIYTSDLEGGGGTVLYKHVAARACSPSKCFSIRCSLITPDVLFGPKLTLADKNILIAHLNYRGCKFGERSDPLHRFLLGH